MDPPVAEISPFLGRHTVTRICLGRVVGGGVSGQDEGGCAVANRVVSGLAVQKINALMNEKGLCPPKKHTRPSNKDLAFVVQNRFYYWGGIGRWR